MQRGVGESRVERLAELHVCAASISRASSPLARAAPIMLRLIVDADDVGAALHDLERQRPVAAADVEDLLARLRVEQVERRRAQLGTKPPTRA